MYVDRGEWEYNFEVGRPVLPPSVAPLPEGTAALLRHAAIHWTVLHYVRHASISAASLLQITGLMFKHN